MKINGRKLSGANVEWVIIPRSDGDLVFKATAVLDASRFDTLCKEPKAPLVSKPGKKPERDFNDPEYKDELETYGRKRWAFIFLETFRYSDGLEWETVNYDDPNTWLNYESELKEAGFTNSECQLLYKGMAVANNLNQEKIEEARNRFLASLIQPVSELSLTGGQSTTQSGELVKESA